MQMLPGFAGALVLPGCLNVKPTLSEEKIVDKLSLQNGDMLLDLNPANGGSIIRLRWQDLEIMRPSPPGPIDVAESAGFPLVPIVNRIPEGKFNFEGRSVDLEGNFMGMPEFIHGYGWQENWAVSVIDKDSVELMFSYDEGEWPWTFEARQTFRLESNALLIELSAKNLSDTNMPTDLGFHPYFPTTPHTRLTADYEGHWVNDIWGVAEKRIEGSFRQDFTLGAGVVDEKMTDQTHYGWNGRCVLEEDGRPDTVITADPACTNLHIFFPPNGNFVAIEPTLGRGNPFGVLPREYRILAPGQVTSIWMRVAVG